MHLSPPGLTLLLALAIGGCRGQPSPKRSSPDPVEASAPRSTPVSVRDLCWHRPRCSTAKRQPAVGVVGTEFVVIQVAPAPDASADQERCKRREYWLSGASGDLLIAADCDVQWGADNTGPAEVRMNGSRIEIRYIEYQSNDRCESYTATVDVVGPTIVSQNRLAGAVSRDTCVPTQKRLPLPPAGDGALGHPLLTLHRE